MRTIIVKLVEVVLENRFARRVAERVRYPSHLIDSDESVLVLVELREHDSKLRV